MEIQLRELTNNKRKEKPNRQGSGQFTTVDTCGIERGFPSVFSDFELSSSMTLKGQYWPDEKDMKSFPIVLFPWCFARYLIAAVGWCPKGMVSTMLLLTFSSRVTIAHVTLLVLYFYVACRNARVRFLCSTI